MKRSKAVCTVLCTFCFQIVDAWSGLEAYNTWDQSPVVGEHPGFDMQNCLLAIGPSGHGVQMAPAIARACTEEIFDRVGFQFLNLNRFTFDRILNDVQVRESKIPIG